MLRVLSIRTAECGTQATAHVPCTCPPDPSKTSKRARNDRGMCAIHPLDMVEGLPRAGCLPCSDTQSRAGGKEPALGSACCLGVFGLLGGLRRVSLVGLITPFLLAPPRPGFTTFTLPPHPVLLLHTNKDFVGKVYPFPHRTFFHDVQTHSSVGYRISHPTLICTYTARSRKLARHARPDLQSNKPIRNSSRTRAIELNRNASLQARPRGPARACARPG